MNTITPEYTKNLTDPIADINFFDDGTFVYRPMRGPECSFDMDTTALDSAAAAEAAWGWKASGPRNTWTRDFFFSLDDGFINTLSPKNWLNGILFLGDLQSCGGANTRACGRADAEIDATSVGIHALLDGNPTAWGNLVGGAVAGALGAKGLTLLRNGPPTIDILRYDPDFTIGQIARGGQARASDLVDFGVSQGWRRTQTAAGPISFVDENGVTRLTIKSGSPRAPGSDMPHIEIRNAAGQRIDMYGNDVTRRSPGNHTPIIWDLGS